MDRQLFQLVQNCPHSSSLQQTWTRHGPDGDWLGRPHLLESGLAGDATHTTLPRFFLTPDEFLSQSQRYGGVIQVFMPAMFLAGPQRRQVSHLRTVICQMFRPEDATSLPAWPSPLEVRSPLSCCRLAGYSSRPGLDSHSHLYSPSMSSEETRYSAEYRLQNTECTAQHRFRERGQAVELWHFLLSTPPRFAV